MKTYNKGEWGEFYTVVKILSDRSIAVADTRLNSRGESINVLGLFMKSVYGDSLYDVTGPRIVLFVDGKLVKHLDLSSDDAKSLFDGISSGTGRSFSIPVANKIMQNLELDSIKASSYEKADIVMETDIPFVGESGAIFRTGAKKEGFTVKSMIGAKPTLLNTSRSTNFTFQIEGFDGDTDEINSIDSGAKIMKRIQSVRSRGGVFRFYDMVDVTFRQNLRLIDYNLPEILSATLLAYFTTSGSSKLPDLVEQIIPKLSFQTSPREVEYKLKEFLVAVALGMHPTVPWNGETMNGGCIIAKTSGDLVCFTLLDKDEFKNYLYNSIKLDSPSSSRHDYGSLYEKYGKLFMNLNIQLRFV